MKKGPFGPIFIGSARAAITQMAGLFRPDHHHHLLAFQLGHAFDFASLADIAGNPVQQLKTQLLVRHFAATEAQGHLDLVALAKEFQHRAHLDLIIMLIRAGTELDFLDLDDLLLFAGLSLTLLRLIFEFAKVHDLTDRRLGIRRDLDQIKPGFFGKAHSAGRGDNTDVLAVGSDQSDFRGPDPIIDARAGFALRRGVVGATSYDCGPSKGKSR